MNIKIKILNVIMFYIEVQYYFFSNKIKLTSIFIFSCKYLGVDYN